MLKRFAVAFAALFAFVPVSFAAGTIPGISMTQQLDNLAKPLSGGKLYLIQAGTVSTPQNCYQDSSLTIVYPNPITLDAYGRVPQLFCADGSIKIRLTDKNGVTIVTQDNLLVVGPSGGGGGGGTVDPTTILSTGDMKLVYNTGVYSGFVRANGRTIGSATSGATERANSDCQALFLFLWAADSNLSVSGGRGGSAAADWAANKTITLPDFRGRVPAGLDDMGSSAAGRLTATYFGSVATTLGVANGSESQTLTTAQMPSHNHGVTDPGHGHPGSFGRVQGNAGADVTSAAELGKNNGAPADTQVLTIASNTTGVTIQNTGGGTAHPIVQPTILVTIYIKL